ncbi:MAG: hypothetical protein JSS45_05135 [Proteobacteria bacterium]|nr:hypothetical protein [Pseudomonadota bacterium]
MRLRTLVATLAFALVLAAPLASAQQFSSLEERMSSADFKAAGLDKLSPEELARLNAFIRGEVDKRTAVARQEGMREQDRNDASKMGFRDYHGDRDVITSTITGDFRGWQGGTTFTLDNGQVWHQIEADQFSIRLKNPTVTITPGLMGTWFLRVEGYGSSTKVERIK